MYIIGDVHGCFLTLKSLVEKIGEDSEFYSVGDLVDKGPDSCKTLDYVMGLSNFKMVLGNHETKYIEYIERYIDGEDLKDTIWYNRWGGRETLESYKHLGIRENRVRKMKEHLEYLKAQEYYFYFKEPMGKINKKILITHGFALPYFKKRFMVKNDSLTQKQFTCNRLNSKHFNLDDPSKLSELGSYNTINIFGHVANPYPLRSNLFIDVDTSCVYGNRLTCYDVANDKFISVKCIDKVKYSWH